MAYLHRMCEIPAMSHLEGIQLHGLALPYPQGGSGAKHARLDLYVYVQAISTSLV